MPKKPDDRRTVEKTIEELIAKSSFGTPGAKAVRAKTPDDVAARIVARSEEIRRLNICAECGWEHGTHAFDCSEAKTDG